MRWILSLTVFFVLGHARAEMETERVGTCDFNGGHYAVLLEKDAPLREAAELTVVTSDIEPLTKQYRSTLGVYRPSQGIIELPSFWRPQALPLRDCTFTNPRNRDTRELPMLLQQYFIYGEPRWDIDLEAMIRSCDAIPVMVRVLCRVEEEEGEQKTLFACSSIRILDEIIEVKSHCFGNRRPDLLRDQAMSVVTLRSGLCDGGEKIESTGTVIEWQGKPLILTSAAAVVSQAGMNSCTDMTSTQGSGKELHLLRQDWASGLAVLEWPENLTAPKPVALKATRVGQYPDQLGVWPANAQAARPMDVLSESSSRHFIPALSRVLEMRTQQVLGPVAIGAPLLNDQGEMLAMISHQYLKIFPGSLTRPMHWQRLKGETTDHALAISATDIQAWLAASTSTGPLWVRPETLRNEAWQIKSGHLLVSESCPPLEGTSRSGEYPIGGGDAVGIGGDASNYRACTIKIGLDKSGSGEFFMPRLQAWHDRLEKILADENQVQVAFHIFRRNTGSLEREYFYSAESFFQSLLHKPNSILAETVFHAGEPGLDPRLKEWRKLSQAVAESAKYVYGFTSDPGSNHLIRRVYFIASLAASEQWSLLSEADFQELLQKGGAYENDWSFLTQVLPEGKKLRNQFEMLFAQWKELK